MKILTTNSSQGDKFGGIHTRKIEHIRNSPQHTFHVIEINHEKKYIQRDNCNIHRVSLMDYLGKKSIFDALKGSTNFDNFNVKVEKLVNSYQNTIRSVQPDVVLIPGTSLTSYFLFKACKREGILNKTVHEYAGVLEKEIGNYTGDTRVILGDIGKQFVSDIARENVTYMFPSQVCKDEVERIHGVKLDNSHIVWNGLPEEFRPGSVERVVPNDLTLGYVGRVHNVKNLPFFLGLNDNMDEKARLNIITDLASAVSKDEGKMLVQKISDGEVFYYSSRDREALNIFYAQKLSANVVPSFFETYCNGAIESLVSGTPTLLSDRTGARDVFEEYGLDDLVFSIDDIGSFNRALGSAKDRDFQIDLKTREELYETLSWKKVIGRYNAIAESVANK